MNIKIKSRILGSLMVLMGIVGTVDGHYKAISEGVYMMKASILFPFFIFLGFSIILYPSSKVENFAKFGVEQLPWKHYPKGQKYLILIGVVFGFLNLGLVSGYLESFFFSNK